jgi:hypothetical protein
MQTVIEIPPFNATLLIRADFRFKRGGIEYGDIESLWHVPTEANPERYLISIKSGNTTEYKITELIDWLDDVIGLDPHLYTCYDVDIMSFKEDLMRGAI